MPAITFPSTVVTTDIIDQIRTAIGRTVTFYTVLSTDCPDCELDPITNTSSDSFCPTCSGVGYLITYSGTDIEAHITWGYSEQLGWVSGGTLDQGDCRVQIKYSVTNEEVVENANYAVVDGREMEINKRIIRGVPVVNRILVDLFERKKE